MRTIKVNIGEDQITANRASAEAGINYSTIAKEFVKEYKTRRDTVKVVLISRNSMQSKVQKTFYCHPF